MNLTPLLRQLYFQRIVESSKACSTVKGIEQTQRRVLDSLLERGRKTRWGAEHRFDRVSGYESYARETGGPYQYSHYRQWVMGMVNGERDLLWPGVTRNFAQSSGTSDGKSKYIPVTPDSFRLNHYRGGAAVVAHYLNLYRDSRLFAGKAFILGGSFANELKLKPGVRVGDLSANLIENINPLADMVRIPSRRVALLEDWTVKLPALVEASLHADVTNISGVPSWFMTVIKEVIARAGADTIHDVWPNLEVFFHGGISMEPYREQYRRLTDPSRMRYLESYNASEGFFAVQNELDDNSMLLLLDAGIFYEFIPLEDVDADTPRMLPAWQLEQGKVYALVITACNGLWRYAIGDTVKVESVEPLKIRIAGRTKHYINAFGEELMVDNADMAIAAVEHELDCEIANYTAAPVYAGDRTRGRHQWLIEFNRRPAAGIDTFAARLDDALRHINSDYDAKRSGNLFLDPLSVTVAPTGIFDRWLAATGKLGGQRKIPRLCNDRHIIDAILALA